MKKNKHHKKVKLDVPASFEEAMKNIVNAPKEEVEKAIKKDEEEKKEREDLELEESEED